MDRSSWGTALQRPRVIALVGAIGLVLSVVIAVVAVRAGGSDSDAVDVSSAQPAAQVSAIRQGCVRWSTSAADNAEDGTVSRAGDPAWCEDLAQWMRTHMMSSGMGPQMMWGDADQARLTCRQAIASTEASGDASWCDAMVDWMSTHMRDWTGSGDWSGWMGSMMRGPNSAS